MSTIERANGYREAEHFPTTKHDGANVYRGMENQYDEAKEKLEQVGQQREAVKNNPNLSSAEKKALLAQLDQAEKALNQALDFTTKGSAFDTNQGSTVGDKDMAAVIACLGRAEASMRTVDQELAATATQETALVSGPVEPNLESVKNVIAEDPRVSDYVTNQRTSKNAKSGASSSSSSGGGLGNMEFGDRTVNEMIEMMTHDPKGLMDHLDSLSEEDRGYAMQMLTQRLQQINQMFSMMSNMAKSSHDTAKAAINNMRV